MAQIRKCTKEDLKNISRLQRRLYGRFFDDGHDDLASAVTAGRAWVATADKKIIGYLTCDLFGPSERNFPDSVFLSELFVVPEKRKRGIGSLLVNAALNENWPPCFKYFSLTHAPGEPHLTAFYKKFGFGEFGKTSAGNIKMVRPRQKT